MCKTRTGWLTSIVGPILARAGFARAHSGWDGDTAQALYCAANGRLVELLPGLPDGTDAPPEPGSCFDFIVNLRDDRLIYVGTDGGSLDRTLEFFGLTGLAAHVRSVEREPVEVAAPVIARAARELFLDYPARPARSWAPSVP
jgi:hypothetical protein